MKRAIWRAKVRKHLKKREVSISLRETTDQPSKHVTARQAWASASNALQNFRKIFAPYHQSSLSLWSSVPTKNTIKPKLFQLNETWTHDFFLLQRTNKLELLQEPKNFTGNMWEYAIHSKAKFSQLPQKARGGISQAFWRWRLWA